VEVVPLVSLRSSSEEMIQLTLPQDDSEEEETSEVPPPAVRDRKSPRKQSQKDKIVRQQAEEKVSSKRASPTTLSRRIQSAVVLPETSSTKPTSPLLGQTRSLSAPTIARDGVPASAAPFPAETGGKAAEGAGRGDSSGIGDDGGLLTIEDLGLRMVVERYSDDDDDDGKKSHFVSCYHYSISFRPIVGRQGRLQSTLLPQFFRCITVDLLLLCYLAWYEF
jgi:hypothetical protein